MILDVATDARKALLKVWGTSDHKYRLKLKEAEAYG
jgi:hypothetical protein